MMSVKKTSPHLGRLLMKLYFSWPQWKQSNSMKWHPLLRRSQVQREPVGMGTQQNECSRHIATNTGSIKHAKLTKSLEKSGAEILNGFVEVRAHRRPQLWVSCSSLQETQHKTHHTLYKDHVINIGTHAMNIWFRSSLWLHAPSVCPFPLLFNTADSCTATLVSIFRPQLECYFVREVRPIMDFIRSSYCCFSIAVIKYHDCRNTQKRGFDWAYGSRGLESTMAEQRDKNLEQ